MARRILSTITLTGVGLLFSMSIALLAPLPFMVMRKSNGRFLFWSGVTAASVGLLLFAPLLYSIVFVAAALLAGIYVECEERGVSYSKSIASSVIVVCLFLTGMTMWSVYKFGFNPVEFMRSQINTLLSQVTMPTGVVIDKESILRQVPSGIVICLVIAAWFNSLIAQRFEVPFKPRKVKLQDWKLADSSVWIALASAAGSFLVNEPLWLKWAATNCFNVVVLLYFFQGLAIIVHFMVTKQIGPMWRTLAYVIAFFQLFVFVALIGFVDLWVDFRRRMKTDNSAIA